MSKEVNLLLCHKHHQAENQKSDRKTEQQNKHSKQVFHAVFTFLIWSLNAATEEDGQPLKDSNMVERD